MASYVLYPPIVDGYMPAFVAGKNSYCRVYFSLSKFNGSTDFKNIQVSVTKQSTGEKVVKTSSNGERGSLTVYRATGLMLDVPFTQVEDNLFYLDILTDDVNTSDENYSGWVPGITYKVQLRLSNASYKSDNPQDYGQSTWLNAYASEFSEWSTVCIIKPTCKPTIHFTSINEDNVILGSELIARYDNPDYTEPLYDYKATLLDEDDNVLDESDWLLARKNVNQSSIQYTFKYELPIKASNYKVLLSYNTLNGYHEDIIKECHTVDNRLKVPFIELITLETDYDITKTSTGEIIDGQKLIKISNLYDEEEEGRLAYMLDGNDSENTELSGVYYIRRSDSTTNFTVWKDIKKFDRRDTKAFNQEVWYDYTIKDGIFYKYGIQGVSADGTRGPLRVASVKVQGSTEPAREIPSLREVRYSFLVGQNEQQLKIKLDDKINSFKINVTDSNNNTIGGVYPITRRVGNTKYKTFSIGGLISFNMDENFIFIPKKDIYNGYEDIQRLYQNKEIADGKYNYMYEREFRDKVLEFLTNGKVKLYKSATEGNVLVKLSDVSCTPNQQLSRLVYNFTATATEVAEYSIENCLKYKITSLGEDGNRTHVNPADNPHPHVHP